MDWSTCGSCTLFAVASLALLYVKLEFLSVRASLRISLNGATREISWRGSGDSFEQVMILLYWAHESLDLRQSWSEELTRELGALLLETPAPSSTSAKLWTVTPDGGRTPLRTKLRMRHGPRSRVIRMSDFDVLRATPDAMCGGLLAVISDAARNPETARLLRPGLGQLLTGGPSSQPGDRHALMRAEVVCSKLADVSAYGLQDMTFKGEHRR